MLDPLHHLRITTSLSFSAIMANPRKFSEKIALHNQKQAEETAAFEAIMREVTGATRGAGIVQKQHHLHISHPNLGAYRGGSLPNVNQLAGGNSIDLQSALHSLDEMKHGRQTLVDRLHNRSRSRELAMHRRTFPRVDHSPYGNAYLSPPQMGEGWRRTNSDSALHQSAMAPPSEQLSPNTPPQHRRMEVIGEMQVENPAMKNYWDPKKVVSQSRPKSCEVPGIKNHWHLRKLHLRGIYPSQDQDPGGPSIPLSNNTGSLPDLTNLHFPPPLTTPLDAEDQQQQQNYSQQGSLSPTSVHPMGGLVHPSQQSPAQRRRSPTHTPSPLILGSPTHMRHSMPPQGSWDARLHHTYQLYHQSQEQQQQQQQQQQQSQQHQQQQQQNHLPSSQQNHSQTHMVNHQQLGYRGSQPSSPTSPLSQQSLSPTQSPGVPTTTNSNNSNSPFTVDAYYLQQQQQTNALQHQFEQFNMRSPSHAQNQSHLAHSVPQQSQSEPTIESLLGIDMLQDNLPTSLATSVGSINSSMNNGGIYQQSNMHFSQANMHGLHGSQEFQSNRYYNNPHNQEVQSIGQSQYTGQQNNMIPDIILTGADESLSRQDFARDIGTAIGGMPADTFDSSDFFPSDEALKVGLDPLDFDGLQMLSDPNMVAADPDTENQFRLDKLDNRA